MNLPISEAFNFTSVTEEEIRDIIINLKDCSPGHDMIESKLLKVIYPDIIMPLLHIFNLSLDQGIVPVELKMAKITPVYRSCYF